MPELVEVAPAFVEMAHGIVWCTVATVEPSVNVIVPDGSPAPGACTETLAVNVTGWPNTDGDPDVVTVVFVAALLTWWLASEERLVTKFGSSLT